MSSLCYKNVGGMQLSIVERSRMTIRADSTKLRWKAHNPLAIVLVLNLISSEVYFPFQSLPIVLIARSIH